MGQPINHSFLQWVMHFQIFFQEIIASAMLSQCSLSESIRSYFTVASFKSFFYLLHGMKVSLISEVYRSCSVWPPMSRARMSCTVVTGHTWNEFWIFLDDLMHSLPKNEMLIIFCSYWNIRSKPKCNIWLVEIEIEIAKIHNSLRHKSKECHFGNLRFPLLAFTFCKS